MNGRGDERLGATREDKIVHVSPLRQLGATKKLLSARNRANTSGNRRARYNVENTFDEMASLWECTKEAGGDHAR